MKKMYVKFKWLKITLHYVIYTLLSFYLCVSVCMSQVGAFLKSPKFPIWILGSETHLSVFFTKASSMHSSISDQTHISLTKIQSLKQKLLSSAG